MVNIDYRSEQNSEIYLLKGYLSNEDSQRIRRILKEQGKNQGDLSKKLGITTPSMSRRLTGKAKIRVEELKIIHEYLKIDGPLNVLLPRPNMPFTPKSYINYSWSNLFDSYFHTLSEIFLRLPPEERGTLLGDLEKIVNRYSPGLNRQEDSP